MVQLLIKRSKRYRRSRPARPALVGVLLTLTLWLNACSADSRPTLTPAGLAGGDTGLTTTAATTLPLATLSPTAPVTTRLVPTAPVSSTVTAAATATSAPTVAAATPTPTVSNEAVSTTGCGQTTPITPGTSADQTVAVQPSGARGSPTRSYRLHLPSSYKPNQPQALLLVFHGYGGNAIGMEALTGFSKLADQQDFIAVYPQGIKDDNGQPLWASVGPSADYDIDELDFTSNLLNQLQKEICVDAQRIYATGFSNGGGMSHYLACRLAGRIAAVAPVAGNYFGLKGGVCQPSRAVALLEVHGTADEVIYYEGRPNWQFPGWPLPAIPDYLAGWAKRNGCASGPQIFLDTKEVQGQEWSGCRDNASIVHYQLKNVGHVYPDLLAGQPSREVIWSFLTKHTLYP